MTTLDLRGGGHAEYHRPLNGPYPAGSWAVAPTTQVPADLHDPARARNFARAAAKQLKDKRPALDRLMADVRRGKFDVVLVWKFDRFARSTSHLLRALEEFKSLSVDFVSLSESIDTSSPAGKAMFTILGAIAELERSTIRERVIAGQKAAKRRGVRFGRPSVEVDTDRALKLRKQGLSWRDVSEEVGVAKDTLIRHCEAL